MSALFRRVLVANRGEIAVRIIATLHRLGIVAVAVYSDSDADAPQVRYADLAVRLGPPPAAESYLDIDRIVAAARDTGATAVHPGYGFLSENAAFARAVVDAGLVFIGPSPATIEIMGDKIAAKVAVAAAGVPVLPSRGAPGMGDDELRLLARQVGYPLLIKPAGGGGGKGMHRVDDSAGLSAALAAARREARSAFGDDTLLLERLVEHARHVEVQILADAHGTTLYLGDRDCSLQRRHQKMVEEAPAPGLAGELRNRMAQAALAAARSVGYLGVGTVEFLVPAANAPAGDWGDFAFLEMNTRLQVEHPVTECVTGVDLVEQQLRVAAGEVLALRQQDVRCAGHAIEARIYAEDPNRGFLPTTGHVLALRQPTGDGIRVDSGLVAGGEVGSDYDPMLAKVIAHGADRLQALARLDAALADTAVLGVTTNVAYLRRLLSHAGVQGGEVDTGLVERDLATLSGQVVPASIPIHVYAAFALHQLRVLTAPGRASGDPWRVFPGWRAGGEAAPLCWHVSAAGAEPVRVWLRAGDGGGQLTVGRDQDPVDVAASTLAAGELLVAVAGQRSRALIAVDRTRRTTWVHGFGGTWALTEVVPQAASAAAADHTGELRSPMPGTVVAIAAPLGAALAAGDAVVVVEAMKMEHSLVAPFAGTISELAVRVGERVALDQLLARVTPPGGD